MNVGIVPFAPSLEFAANQCLCYAEIPFLRIPKQTVYLLSFVSSTHSFTLFFITRILSWLQHQCDLVVIGAGPGGYVAAIRASQLILKKNLRRG